MLLAVGQVASLATSVPYSFAWTPPPWRPAYQWASGADLDIGQGGYQLRAWVRHHEHPYVAYNTTRGLTVGAGSRDLPRAEQDGVRGWVAVGATTLLQSRRRDLAWLRAYCPVDTIAGGSILVYRIVGPPDLDPGPERPVAPCYGAKASTRPHR